MAVCNTRNQKLGKKFGCFGNSQYFCKTKDRVRGRAEVARRAHNPEVVGSSPAPATKAKRELKSRVLSFVFCTRENKITIFQIPKSQNLSRLQTFDFQNFHFARTETPFQ